MRNLRILSILPMVVLVRFIKQNEKGVLLEDEIMKRGSEKKVKILIVKTENTKDIKQ